MELKDIVTINISSLALIVSGFTAYSTLIKKVDAVSIILQGDNQISKRNRFSPKMTMGVWSTPSVTVVNSGNRPAAIISIEFQLRIESTAIDDKTCKASGVYQSVAYEFKPFVVEAGKITIEQPKLKNPDESFQDGDWALFVADTNAEGEAYFLACLSINVSTPDEKVINTMLPMLNGKILFKSDDPIRGFILYDETKPYKIIDKKTINLY